jgi:hypothetical protein
MKKFFLILIISCLLNNVSLAASFTCDYSGGSSKIKISGSTAIKTTSAGVVITYSNANKTPKGAYNLQGPSKNGRAWFIGAMSFLLLDVQMISAQCR